MQASKTAEEKKKTSSASLNHSVNNSRQNNALQPLYIPPRGNSLKSNKSANPKSASNPIAMQYSQALSNSPVPVIKKYPGPNNGKR